MPVYGGQTQYATTTDLANLGLIGGVLSSIPAGVQNAALIAASGVADSSLQSAFVLPLTQWGQSLVRAVCIIAAYDLLTSKGYNPATGADPNIRQRYLDALQWLKDVGAGKETPEYVIDSAVADSAGLSASENFQIVTSPVRGWTPRGNDDLGGTFWEDL